MQSNKAFETLNIANSLKNLWDVESAGINKESYDIYKDFETELTFCDKTYLTKLPFRFYDEVIPNNFRTAKSRLNSLQRKFDKDPSLFEKYSGFIEDHKSQGIIQEVKDSRKLGNVHYLPHQPVVRTERDTAKLRIVFDASSKTSNEPSLNQLLHSGPCLLPLLYDILLQFRLGKFAIKSDIKQTFLQIELDVMHRDFTRVLWFSNFYSENRDNVIYRFIHTLFRLTCSPFILTGTLKHHFKKFSQENTYPKVFIEKLLRDLYVDNLLK